MTSARLEATRLPVRLSLVRLLLEEGQEAGDGHDQEGAEPRVVGEDEEVVVP